MMKPKGMGKKVAAVMPQAAMSDGMPDFSDSHKKAGFKSLGSASGAPVTNDGPYNPAMPVNDSQSMPKKGMKGS